MITGLYNAQKGLGQHEDYDKVGAPPTPRVDDVKIVAAVGELPSPDKVGQSRASLYNQTAGNPRALQALSDVESGLRGLFRGRTDGMNAILAGQGVNYRMGDNMRGSIVDNQVAAATNADKRLIERARNEQVGRYLASREALNDMQGKLAHANVINAKTATDNKVAEPSSSDRRVNTYLNNRVNELTGLFQ